MFGGIRNVGDPSQSPEPGQGPTRQRSFKDRLRDGISHGLAWQNKSKSMDQAGTRPLGGASPPLLPSFGPRGAGEQEGKDVKMGSSGGLDVADLPTYVVQNADTLNSVAAKFGLTPSELAKANRLSSRYVVFPGQTLKVPRGPTPATTVTPCVDILAAGGDANPEDVSNSPSEKGRSERLGSSLSSGSGSRQLSRESDDLDRDSLEKFLKLHVRHVSDGQGVVDGVLLVTPNAVMFDPNVSDPLVIENGAEAYGLIAPLELVVNSAIYFDMVHSKTKDGKYDPSRREKGEIYYGKGTIRRDPSIHLEAAVCDETVSEKRDESEEKAQESSTNTATIAPQPTKPVLDSPKRVPVEIKPEPKRSSSTCSSGSGSMLFSLNPREILKSISGDDREPESPCHTPPVHPPPGLERQESKKQKVLKRLSNPLQWIDSLGSMDSQNSSHPNTPPTNSSLSSPLHTAQGHHSPSLSATVFSKMFSRSQSSETGTRKAEHSRSESGDAGKLTYRNVMSMDDMPDLFASIDKLLPKMTTPAWTVEPPLYLCLRTGRPKNKRIPCSTPVVAYGVRKVLPEYWFLVPQSRAEELYVFLRTWMPDLYGEVNEKYLADHDMDLVEEELLLENDGQEDGRGMSAADNASSHIGDLKESWEFRRFNPWTRAPGANSTIYGTGAKARTWAMTIASRVSHPRITQMIKAPYTRLYSLVRTKAPRPNLSSLEHAFEIEPYEKNVRSAWWSQVVSASEDEVQQALHGSNTDDEFIPELVGDSEIFNMQQRKHLIRVIPARCQGYPWRLGFSTSRDGFSLASLYRKMECVDSCVLLMIQDTQHNVFGALLSDAPTLQDHFYGTGESFVFSFTPPRVEEKAEETEPENGDAIGKEVEEIAVAEEESVECGKLGAAEGELEIEDKDADAKNKAVRDEQAKMNMGKHFRVFKWSGENSFFIRSQPDSLTVGAGDGHFGLLLDGDLNHGRTDVCSTFRNDVLAADNDFVILTIECWFFE
ncbi:unnamed protein product [Notodromas monacha]|uniref:Oxidation resistance protein 1 n=1 Tax=Notodromas monacha TaxID=399045 RepID=A0A7R9BGT0_9CRUS|nr:unnamed protein product [Notodromas monacha]CAG0915193.1 unnamed protein product [Notodromas monacha]